MVVAARVDVVEITPSFLPARKKPLELEVLFRDKKPMTAVKLK